MVVDNPTTSELFLSSAGGWWRPGPTCSQSGPQPQWAVLAHRWTSHCFLDTPNGETRLCSKTLKTKEKDKKELRNSTPTEKNVQDITEHSCFYLTVLWFRHEIKPLPTRKMGFKWIHEWLRKTLDCLHISCRTVLNVCIMMGKPFEVVAGWLISEETV